MGSRTDKAALREERRLERVLPRLTLAGPAREATLALFEGTRQRSAELDDTYYEPLVSAAALSEVEEAFLARGEESPYLLPSEAAALYLVAAWALNFFPGTVDEQDPEFLILDAAQQFALSSGALDEKDIEKPYAL